jgi:DtxR family Mn-dependent transcriptional regulator
MKKLTNEHSLTKEDLDELAAKLGNPLYDPHGDPIPTSSGEIQNLGGQPLTDIPAGTAVRIVHLENEPQAVYAQIVAEGLYPGMIVQVIESTPTRITFWANGEEHHLAPIIAANIEVKKLPQAIKKDQLNQGIKTLYQIPIGEKAKVIEISPRLRGAERRRFFDLGILPGTIIETEMISPSGETKAYKIRGSLIALRKEQAEAIKVIPLPEVSS